MNSKEQLEQLFENNFDGYMPKFCGKDEMGMSKDKNINESMGEAMKYVKSLYLLQANTHRAATISE